MYCIGVKVCVAWGSMCLVGWGYWGVQRQAVEALGGEMPGVGVRVREGMLLEELWKLWNGRS